MNNPKPETGNSKPRQPFGRWIHQQVFGLAQQVHREALGNAELLEAIRADIVRFGIGSKPSLSVLTAAQKAALVNRYLESLGRKWRVHVPKQLSVASCQLSENSNRQSSTVNQQSSDNRQLATGNYPSALPTADQRELLTRLFDKLNYPQGEPRARFCYRCCRFRTPPDRTAINKVIEGLKAMDRRGYKYGQATKNTNDTKIENSE